MLYATINCDHQNLSLAIRKDLKTVKGYVAWARRWKGTRRFAAYVRIWRSGHPDHCYGKDTLVSVQRI